MVEIIDLTFFINATGELNRMPLPDQPYINQIRARLWRGREFGSVAVMVGAGFSQNAERVAGGMGRMPQWNDLMRAMQMQLTLQGPIERLGASEALRIAGEYELVFGRPALDGLLINTIQDKNFLPGKLHGTLLSLPWSDVFTTNYDTLLERTTPYIYDRKYEVVLTPSDIHNRMRPRIVKLHGSFPSHRPFIITEEDFRTYPRKFAPFVNLVQQSVMENVLCLVGFSGDDPNFLNWIGWVRDNLGVHTPPIYLCGFVGATERRKFESRGITPIDLTPLFPGTASADPLKYQKGLEWFLANLRQGEPPQAIYWPIPTYRTALSMSERLPPVPEGPRPFPELGVPWPSSPPGQSLDDDIALGQRSLWRRQREQYPGWIVAPHDTRANLVLYTENWIYPLLSALERFDGPNALSLLFEMNWRIQMAFLPWKPDWAERWTKVLDNFNPFRDEMPERTSFDWDELRENWTDLCFSLVRHYREQQDSDNFEQWITHLEKVVDTRPEWRARWHYERCQWSLARFDLSAARDNLNQWKVPPELPYWQLKRGAVAAELGDLEVAAEQCEAALNSIRQRLQGDEHDLGLLSVEGWCMMLLGAIRQAKGDSEEFLMDFRARWSKLANLLCNPHPDWNLLKAEVLAASYVPIGVTEVTHGFDPGIVRETINYGSQNPTTFATAYGLVRMMEDGGLPYRVGIVVFDNVALSKAAELIHPASTPFALGILGRANSDRLGWFDRLAVANLADTDVSSLFDWFVPALEQALAVMQGTDSGTASGTRIVVGQRLVILAEVLSRLMFRCNEGQRHRLMEIGIRLAHEKHPRWDNTVTNWFRRLFKAMTPQEVVSHLPLLLELPVREQQIDLFTLLGFPRGFRCTPEEQSTWERKVKDLIHTLSGGDAWSRTVAAVRLKTLLAIDGLTPDDRTAFSAALWERMDPDNLVPGELYALPRLVLQVGGREDAQKTMKLWFLKRSPSDSNPMFPEAGRAAYFYLASLLDCSTVFVRKDKGFLTLDWTSGEASVLLHKIMTWSATGLEGASRDFRRKTRQVVDFVIIPNLEIIADSDASDVRSLLKLLEDPEDQSSLPMMCLVGLLSIDEMSERFRTGLAANEPAVIDNVVNGIVNWTILAVADRLPPVPNGFIDDLIDLIYYRRVPGLEASLEAIATLLGEWDIPLIDSQITRINVALSYLFLETQRRELYSRDIVPSYRAAAAGLARATGEWCHRKGITLPPVVEQWYEEGRKDPLPEVREVFWEI